MSPALIEHSAGSPLMEWANANEPADELIWKDGYWRQVIFASGLLHPLIEADRDTRKRDPVRVVGTHTSKSVLLPVVSLARPGLELRMRDNFHNRVISVRSERPVPDVFLDLFDRTAASEPIYCEGFPKAWVFPPYAQNQRWFTTTLWGSEHKAYAFVLLLTRATS